MDSYTKNRNRLVNVLDNYCAKIIRRRADYDDSMDKLSLRISNFTAKLRDEEHCHDTVSAFFRNLKHFLTFRRSFKTERTQKIQLKI